ncbi:MAG TPA: DNA alkylation repair protein [Candidatus Paceibacterota bacterium]
MHSIHSTILKELKDPKNQKPSSWDTESYLLSGHTYYGVPVPTRRKIAKMWLREHSNLSKKEFFDAIDTLMKGDSHEEKTIAAILLEYSPEMRKTVTFKQLNEWLNHLVGWAEIDALCSGTFKAEDFMIDWDGWKTFIQKLVKDKNINKRRAALVFLVYPIHYISNPDIAQFSFEVIEELKHEKPIIITKAISWVLRSGVGHHTEAIKKYIQLNQDTLPKIAIRETIRKIETGRK